MASSTRPRTLAEARHAFSTSYELGWWVFMRISGLFLIFLVGAHVFINNILVDAGTGARGGRRGRPIPSVPPARR